MGKLTRWVETAVGRVVPLAVWDKLFRLAMRVRSRRGPTLVTQHERPKCAAAIGARPDPLAEPPRVAVVIQGPPVTAENFTAETVALYRRLFPGCPIILSTWADTPGAVLEQLAAAGAQVVTSQKPADPGFWNVNLQLTSALAGVKAAAASGVEFVLKTRTDQRFYAPHTAEFLANLVRTFPPAAGYQQRGRVVGIGRSTIKYGLYQLTDQSLFGYTEDMLAYWSAPHRTKDQFTFGAAGTSIRHVDRYLAPETYLATQFLERVGRGVEWTLTDSWRAFADHFCVADWETLDVYWAKYAVYNERTTVYGTPESSQPMGFIDWFNLYVGLANKKNPEQFEAILEMEFAKPLPTWTANP
jgi:hypothetical protein